MDTKTSLTPNISCIVFALFVLVFSSSADDQTYAFILAFLVAAAAILFIAYRAAAGDSTQIVAGPVTAVVLFAVFDNFQVQDARIEGLLCLLLLAVALGASVCALLNPGRGRIAVLLMGFIVGVVGVCLTLAAISYHVPGSSLFIPVDDIQKANPLHIDFFRPQYSTAELAERRLHNAASEPSPFLPWRQFLFAAQTVALSAWDALMLSIGVWIAGLAVTLVMKLFTKENS